MRHVKKIILMALSAVMVIAATAYGKENKEKEETTNSDNLIGKWISYSSDGANVLTYTLQFNKDGSVVMSFSNGDPEVKFSWTLKATTLTLTKNGENVSATFNGETIVIHIGSLDIGPFIKEGDKGLGEEDSKKNLIGVWMGSYSDKREGETLCLCLFFEENGEGLASIDISYDHAVSPDFRMVPFTWTLTGVKLVLKFSISDSSFTAYYNGRKAFRLGPMILTKE